MWKPPPSWCCPRQTRAASLVLVALAFVPFVTLGCTRPASPYPSARVSGSVTLDGQPLGAGNISFMPEGAGPSQPAAVEFQGGTYTMDQAPLGKVRVRIISTQETGNMIAGSGEMEPEVVDVVPAKYRQGIEIDVTGDRDDLDFHLTSE